MDELMAEILGDESTPEDRETREYLEDLRKVIRTEEGLRVFRRILDRVGLIEDVFTGNSKTFYLAGRQSVGGEIFRDLVVADPKSAQQVLLEGYRQAAKRYKEQSEK